MNATIISSALFILLYTFEMRKKHIFTKTLLYVLDEEPKDIDAVIRLMQPTWMYLCDYLAWISLFCMAYFMIMQYEWWAILGIPINLLIIPQLTKIVGFLDKYFLKVATQTVEKKYQQRANLNHREIKYLLKFKEWILINKQMEIINNVNELREDFIKKHSK